MRRRLALVSLVAFALLGASCDSDRLPQSPNALGPGANRFHDAPMTGHETRDNSRDSAVLVIGDPL